MGANIFFIIESCRHKRHFYLFSFMSRIFICERFKIEIKSRSRIVCVQRVVFLLKCWVIIICVSNGSDCNITVTIISIIGQWPNVITLIIIVSLICDKISIVIILKALIIAIIIIVCNIKVILLQIFTIYVTIAHTLILIFIQAYSAIKLDNLLIILNLLSRNCYLLNLYRIW